MQKTDGSRGVTVSARALRNDGKIISNGNAMLRADRIVGSGTFGSGISPAGTANADGSLTLDAKEIIQTNANLLSGKDISLTADNIHTENTTIAGNGDVSVTAEHALSIEKSILQSGKNLSVRAETMPLTGNLFSGKDMTLTLRGDLDNTSAADSFGNLHAGGNLTADVGGDVRNQKKIEANGTLRLTARGNLSQIKPGEINGQNLHLVTADLSNQGLLQADACADITAAHLKNNATGGIYADRLSIHAKSITNEKNAALEARLAAELTVLKEKAALLEDAHLADVTKFTTWSEVNAYKEKIQEAEAAYDAQQTIVDTIKAELDALPSGTIAAREHLSLTADTIRNTGNALLYAGKDMELSAAEGLLNRGARMEAQGNITISAPVTKNENAAFSTKRVITETRNNPLKLRIDDKGHIEWGKAFPAVEFSKIDNGYGAYHSYAARMEILEPAEYRPLEQISAEEEAAGQQRIPEDLIGTLMPTYAYDDPIFERFDITSMPTDRPAADDPARAAWDAEYRTILAQLNDKITVYNAQAEEHNKKVGTAAGQKINRFSVIRSDSLISKEHVTSSLPGRILAGGNILLNSAVENEDSNIVAGGTLHARGAVRADAAKQQELAVTFGTEQSSRTERRSRLHKGKIRKYGGIGFMTPEIAKSNPSPIGIQTYAGGSAVPVDRTDITNTQRAQIQNALSPFGLAPSRETVSNAQPQNLPNAPSRENIDRTQQPLSPVRETQNTEDRQSEPLFVSSLYRVSPEPTAHYLIETDPAFTNKRNFLSSDYMYRQMKWDPDKIPKRIGDGFYEQQLLVDQILKQTGKRHLEGYTDDETAFRALMDSGITYAKEMNITPGIALSKEQVASLTSDMIWLEERDVYVNGKKERAVYPVLYTKNTNGLRLTAGGSLISAKNIAIETKDALKNAGTLYGENILAHAGDIENTGLIRGQKIGLKSERDIRVQGSVIGDKAVVLEAKNNIDVSSTTERLAHQDVLNTTAGIAVKGDEGVLVVSAGKNAALAGATLAALGKNGSVLLSAGENISLDTKKLQSDKDMTADAANYLRTKRGTELAAEIRADSNISVTAGHDLNMRAAEVSSKNGTASLSAGNDISLTAGREASEDHYGIRYKGSGLLSSKTTTIRIDTESDTARTANITGQNVNIAAKRDAVFEAANIAADNDVNIAVGRNVSVTSAENYSHTENYEEVRKSGIFGSGGLGFTIGTQQTKTTRDSDALTQQGTNISALGGSVSISAGETAHISSGNILANKDATVTAKETIIDGKDSIYRESITQESKTTGLTVSLGHGLLDLGQSLYAPISRIGEVQDDRLKAAYAYQTGRMIHDAFKKNPLTNATFSLNVSFGTSKSYSHMESTTHEYAGSRIASGGNTNITAGERDLTVKGSTIEGKDMSLTAKGNVRLEAGENTSITTTENKFSSASIGASFTPQGLSNISVNASKGNGNSKESVTAYSPALVSAQDNLSLTSGKDMDIIGSKAQGEKTTVNVGGNLNIETLQEKETYEEQNSSTGFGFSWGVKAKDKQTSTKSTGQTQNPPTTNAANSTPKPNGTQVTSPTGRKFFDPTIGGSRNKGTVDSHYRSARDQAGFFAGSKGFDIYARENTDLKGGIIASNAPSDKNHLSTGTFSFSDLKNEADYSAKSTGSAYHKYGNYDNMSEDEQNKVFNTIGLAPVLPMPVVGSADSTTKAAVAPAAIDIRENPTQDISALSRDTVNALNELGRIFDKQTMEERQELAAVFGEEAFRLLHNMKDDGSIGKIAAHAIIGGLMSQITGAGFASGAIGAGLNEALIKSLKGLDPGTAQIVSAVIGAAAAKAIDGNAQAGASAAASGTKWNFFLMKYPNLNGVGALAQHTLKRKDGKEISSEEVLSLVQGMNNIFSEAEPERANAQNMQSENINNYPKAISYLMSSGVTKESAIQFFKEYNTLLRKQNWNVYSIVADDVHISVDERTKKPIEDIQIQRPKLSKETLIKPYPPDVFTGENLVLPNTPLTTHEKKDATGAITNPGRENHGDKSDNQSKAALGKTVAIETFKAEADHPVTLYNKYANPVKALKLGIFAPLGLGYDMYQDYGKYSGTDLAKVTLVNGGAFAFTTVVDSLLIGSAGMSVEATIPANIAIVEAANGFKKIWARSDEEKRKENP